MPFALESAAFAEGDEIPRRHLREGDNLSPPLAWHEAPVATRSFVLLVEDPDAPGGTFRHWAAFDIPADRSGLPEGASAGEALDMGARNAKLPEGLNDFGNAGYDGPQPPRGHGVHHYRFRLAALDVEHLDLPEQPQAAQVWEAARPHLLAEAQLTGTYENR